MSALPEDEANEPLNYRLSDLKSDLRNLLEYNYADELDDFEQRNRDGDDTSGHVFVVIDRLSKWVEG